MAVAASRIQSVWKGAIARRHVKKIREDELAFIGMIPPGEYPHRYQDKLLKIEEDRRVLQVKLISKIDTTSEILNDNFINLTAM